MPTDTRPQVTHSGRGGAGNIRPSSHSRTREDIKQEAEEEALQEQLIADARGRQAEQAFSTGRGGVGNISRSRSRSKARTPRGESSTRREGSALGLGRRTTRDTVTTGRGGFGNISEEKEKNSIELEKASWFLSLVAFANPPSHHNRRLPEINTKPTSSPSTPPTKPPTLTRTLQVKAAPATS